MQLELRRVILFTDRLEEMTRFYGAVLGLTQSGSAPGWRDFAAGGCHIALHAGKPSIGKRPPKLAFYAPDVAATRAALIARGAVLGPVKSAGAFDMCDGADPDGNPIQLSSRA